MPLGYTLGEHAKKDLDYLRRTHVKRMPNEQQARHRRDEGDDGSSDSNGNGGSSGCACCGCLNCVDLCDQATDKVVTDCDACTSGATKTVTVNLGDLGVRDLEYQGACIWSKDFTYSSGTYRATYTANGALSTCVVTWVSGSDPLLLNTTRVISYKADPGREWSCLCNSVMIPAVKGERFPKDVSLNCEICISPKAETSGPNCDLFEFCWDDLEFDGVSWGCGGLTTGNTAATPALTAGGGSFWVGTTLYCPYQGQVNVSGPPDWYASSIMRVVVGLIDNVVGAAAELHVSVRLPAAEGVGVLEITARYRCDVPAEGVNTFVFIEQTATTGSECVETTGPPIWPDTVTIAATDCTFGANHPDYGYGCGGGGHGDCGGLGCRYVAFDQFGTPQGETGPWTWGEFGTPGHTPPAAGCGDTGCACAAPPSDPPTSSSDEYFTSCV